MKDTKQFYGLTLLLLLGLFALAACGTKVAVPPGLLNAGILPLSDKDPYHGANFFLSREMEISSYLHSFFKGEGAPVAIELRQRRFRGIEASFFYPKGNRVFVGTPQEIDEHNRQWIIRGPYAIERPDFRQVDNIQRGLKDEPVFVLFGREYRFRGKSEPERRQVLPPVALPTPRPTPRRTVRPAPTPATSPTPTPAPAPKVFSGLTFDQIAILMSQGYAERNQAGDVIHTVTKDNETLARIARWYTGSAEHAAAIATANALGPESSLARGMRLRVPLSLVSNNKALPADYK